MLVDRDRKIVLLSVLRLCSVSWSGQNSIPGVLSGRVLQVQDIQVPVL